MSNKFLLKFQCVFIIWMLAFAVGCSSSSDDKPIIQVCNSDDEEYVVQLHMETDNSVIKWFELGEWYDLSDSCDQFENIDEALYYLTIKDKNSENIEDRSNNFYMENGDYRAFRIDSTGSIRGDLSEDEGTIQICNNDNEEYRIELVRVSDNQVIGQIYVDEAYDLADRCREFKNIEEDTYYIIIYEEDSSNIDKTESFYLDGGEFEDFVIDSTGTIEKR